MRPCNKINFSQLENFQHQTAQRHKDNNKQQEHFLNTKKKEQKANKWRQKQSKNKHFFIIFLLMRRQSEENLGWDRGSGRRRRKSFKLNKILITRTRKKKQFIRFDKWALFFISRTEKCVCIKSMP